MKKVLTPNWRVHSNSINYNKGEMMLRKIIYILIISSIAITLSADIFPTGFGGNPNPFSNFNNNSSLLNVENMDMGHTLSFMAGGGSNSQGFYQSMYTNHLMYRVNDKLQFNLDLNFVNYGTATFNKDFDIEGNNDNRSNVVPAFNMQYKPSDNTTIEFRFQYGGYRSNRFWNSFDERYSN